MNFKLSAALAALCTTALTGAAIPDYPRMGPPWKPKQQPEWTRKGLVFVGSWEPLPWLYRKNWANWTNAPSGKDAEADYREERSEAAILGLKNLGVNMFLTGFHKGFGIDNEKDTMEDARVLAALLHKHGMKMGVYVSALLLYEELYREFPQSRQWHRLRADGTPDVYDNDGFRYRAFLNHPEYINYMKRVCELAVKAGADLIHFDVIQQPFGNYHPMAETMFRKWLQARYPETSQKFFRTGLHFFDYVKIPVYADINTFGTLDQPMIQEYLRFSTQLLGDYAAELSTFIHALNPECAVEFNPQGITGVNRALNGIDHEAILPWLDSYWSEEPNHADFTADGRLVSKIRSYKVGERYGSQMFAYTAGELPSGDRDAPRQADPRPTLAEAMAFNRQCLGNVGSPLAYKDFPASGRRYIEFFWKQFDLFAPSAGGAEVGVLRGFASMSFNNHQSHRQVGLAEQALIQSQVPFDIVHDRLLEDLSRYKVLVLADQESLSDRQVQAIARFVKSGGGIVASGSTGAYDDWRRRRKLNPLAELLGAAPGKAALRKASGAGRAAWLPGLTPRTAIPPKVGFVGRFWAPPSNTREFIDAVTWTAKENLSFRVAGPPSVAAQVYYQADKKRYILHLLNYNGLHGPDVNLSVTVKLPGAGRLRFTAHSPDQAAPVELQATPVQGGHVVKMPPIDVYGILVVQL